ncbi:hypothetical protein FEM41_01870 [Jejubacter calystegiae]|uniref:Gp5/Type VI secretion system Vgr protein OB-fold domain-containing protein n=1 Tax=Jejubacter calystegiae TaxID=2579935 RepID=A0A4P8YG54_9ENTR|nr:hypothetical protein [Jejubacter calystegiae]QCT18474.1 hypothetical protein FEM41_01870 [Jejubacter calystegiae]
MRPLNRLYLSSDEVHVSDVNLVLELNACGRGFITAQTDTDYTGKVVRLDAGYTDQLYRWFTGYVERSQPAENGSQRLFVRELVGIFDKPWACSFQHPTLRTVLDWLAEQSGLTFIVPDGASYASKAIPHFTHSGTGYQLLASLGAAFGVEDYIWYQTPGGDVFAGSAAHGMFAGKPVTIPAEFSRATAAGDSMTLALVPALRPGAEVNGQRITSIRLNNDDMTLTWAVRGSNGKAVTKSPFVRQAEAAFPELASGQHLPKLARVIGPVEDVASGNIADPFRPRYAVHVQLLDVDGNPEANTPEYPAVPLPVPMAGNDSGMFQFPPAGTLVELAFTGGRPDKPFIRQTLAQGNSLPDVKPGEQLQQQREGVSQRVTVAGDWERQTDQAIRETSMSREVSADDERRSLVARETTIQATDKTTVLGTTSLMAGAVQHVATGDYSVATGGSLVANVAKDSTLAVGGNLSEKIAQLRQSIAGARQEMIAPVVWVGSSTINVMQLMLDTLDVVQALAAQTASHTHSNTGAPTNAAAITATGTSAVTLKNKYDPVIG